MVMIPTSISLGSQVLTDNLRDEPMSVTCRLVSGSSKSEKPAVEISKNSRAQQIGKNTFFLDWIGYWNNSIVSRIDILITPIVFIWSLQNYALYLKWNETRTDIEEFALLSDPILKHLTPLDFSVPLFFLAYGSIVLGCIHAIDKPSLIFEFLQTKALVILARVVGLYLTPLEAPKGTIPLVDPLVHGDGHVLVRDLFFSGHTATTFVVFFTCRSVHRRWKLLFLLLGVTTAMMVILQKTHYVIDVYAAPFFVYACHRIVVNIRQILNIAYGYGNFSVGLFHDKNI